MEQKYDKNKAHYIVVTGILIRDGKYLIAKRAEWEKAFPGKWTVPGGKLEVLDYTLRKRDAGELWYNIFEDCVKRECKEEVGLEIENIGYVTSMVYIRPDNAPCVVVSLYANPKEGEIKLCNALTDFKWVNLNEAKNYDLVEGLYKELEILDNYLKAGKMKAWKKKDI